MCIFVQVKFGLVTQTPSMYLVESFYLEMMAKDDDDDYALHELGYLVISIDWATTTTTQFRRNLLYDSTFDDSTDEDAYKNYIFIFIYTPRWQPPSIEIAKDNERK